MDPHYGDQKPQQEPEALDLPDDLNLDDEEEGEGDKEEGAENQQGQYHISDIFIFILLKPISDILASEGQSLGWSSQNILVFKVIIT